MPQSFSRVFAFMKIQFGNEHFRLKKGESGVYKIVFNDKWFYIGSSINLKSRLSAWKHYCNNSNYRKNRSIKFILPLVHSIRFEIIEKIIDGSNPKIKEDFYIKENFDDENCLNLIPDAINGKGRKIPMGVIVKPKRIKGKPTEKKRIAQFDKCKKLVAIHESILAASKNIGCKTDPIRWIIQGNQQAYKGNTFKQVAPDGSFIEPPSFKRKPFAPGRRFFQYDKAGRFIAEHTSATHVARLIKGNRRNLQHVLKGENRMKTYKGFIWKYA